MGDAVFHGRIQILLNLFAFFLVFYVPEVAGISVSFFVFLAIISYFVLAGNALVRVRDPLSALLVGLVFIILLSMIFAETPDRATTVAGDVKLMLQIVYWLLLALFLRTWARYYDWIAVSKYILLGVGALSATYFFFNENPDQGVTQNSYAFTLAVAGPLGAFYAFRRFGTRGLTLLLLGLLILALLGGSRAGALILSLQSFLLLTVVVFRRPVKVVVTTAVVTIVLLMAMSLKGVSSAVIDAIDGVNPELASLVKSPTATLRRDKSWLIRELMVKKALLIFDDHPFLGVGFGYFSRIAVPLEPHSKWLNRGSAAYNQRSAHNTYAMMLAETGIFGLLALLAVQLAVLRLGLERFFQGEIGMATFIWVSFLGMSIYFYAIAALTGAITWFILGLGIACVDRGALR